MDGAEKNNFPTPEAVDTAKTSVDKKETLSPSPEVIEKVNTTIETIALKEKVDGKEEFKRYANENPKIYNEMKAVIDGVDEADLSDFILFNGFIIDGDSYDTFKREFEDVLGEAEIKTGNVEKAKVDVEEKEKRENTKEEMIGVIKTNLDRYTNKEDKTVLEEFIKVVEAAEDGKELEKALNKETIQKVLEVIMNNFDTETFTSVCTFLDNTPETTAVFREVATELKIPDYNNVTENDLRARAMEFTENSNVPLTVQEEAVQTLFGDKERKRVGNKIVCGNVTLNLEDYSRNLKLSDKFDGYIKVDKVDYPSDYKYRLEKVRITKEYKELTAEENSIKTDLNKYDEIIKGNKAEIENIKQDIAGDKEGFMVDANKELLEKLEREIKKAEEEAQNLMFRLEEIKQEKQKLVERGNRIEEEELARKERYLQRVEAVDEQAEQKFEIMRKLGILSIQPLLVKMQGELNLIKHNLDLGEGNEIVSNMDFERGEFGIKPNRYDVTMRLLNVMISGNKDEPFDPGLANSVAREVGDFEGYDKKFMHSQLLKYGIITGIGTYNIETVRENLKSNYKTNKDTQNNKKTPNTNKVKPNNEKSEKKEVVGEKAPAL